MNEKKRKRWSRQARKEVVLRILAGKSIEELSRELQEETYRLEEWRDAAVAAMDIGLQGKGKDVKDKEIEQASVGRQN